MLLGIKGFKGKLMMRNVRYWVSRDFVLASQIVPGQIAPLNPLHPKIKIGILICCPIHFLSKQWGKVFKISSKFILCDHVRNSHDHSVLQRIDITRRYLTLITLKT